MNVGYAVDAILAVDGCVPEIGTITDVEACCPIDTCNVDPCSLMCSFIELLPNGPLWDRAKARGMERYAQPSWCDTHCAPDDDCPTLVDYAAYSGYRLASMIRGPLWSSLREASPYTAVTTIDSWLELYGWSDCWDSICRDPRLGPSPFECGVDDPPLGFCDANFSPIYVPEIPEPLNSAVRRNIAISLTRLQMQPIKNLCGINWVIEPLGARLTPIIPEERDPCCRDTLFEICNISDTIDSVPGSQCGENPHPVQASFLMKEIEYNPFTGRCEPKIGVADFIPIWPAVMAAQCIALSMLPVKSNCETPITRCESIG